MQPSRASWNGLDGVRSVDQIGEPIVADHCVRVAAAGELGEALTAVLTALE